MSLVGRLSLSKRVLYRKFAVTGVSVTGVSDSFILQDDENGYIICLRMDAALTLNITFIDVNQVSSRHVRMQPQADLLVVWFEAVAA